MTKRLIYTLLSLLIVLVVMGCTPSTTTTETTTSTTTTTETTTTTTTSTTTTTTTTTTETTTTTTDNQVTLPDLTGLSRAEISASLTGLGLTVRYYFDNSVVYTSEDQYDKFVMYGQGLLEGNTVAIGTEVRVYTTPLYLNIHYVYEMDEALQITLEDTLGQEFIADGIGVVTVEKYVDGDTTWFESAGTTFSVRYLGIDTPESTALYEPWGKAAANLTQAILSNAETIVLQAEGDRQDGNGRYLAWVWYRNSAEEDFLLLNLQLVELAYSKNKVSAGSVFTSIITFADWDASLTKRRVWGEIDPNYDYSKEGTQMSIEYLMNNFDTYVGLKVCVTGTITRMIGNNIYLQDEYGTGVYMYAGFTTSSQLVVGANVTIAGLTPTYYSGAPQLSNFSKTNLYVNTPGEAVTPLVLTYDQFTFNRIGTLVTLANLTVTYINAAGSTLGVRDASGNTFDVRIDDATTLTAASLGITVGDLITVTGPLSYYDYSWDGTNEAYVYDPANFQLMLTSSEDLVILN